MTDAEGERAWGSVHDALARTPGWAVRPCTDHAEVARWHFTAFDLRPCGRYAKREAITATKATEIAVLGVLGALLTVRQLSGRKSAASS
jgi:hypothetical protein